MLCIERIMRTIVHINIGATIALFGWLYVHAGTASNNSIQSTSLAYLAKEQ